MFTMSWTVVRIISEVQSAFRSPNPVISVEGGLGLVGIQMEFL